jgi:hypothetical protein
LQIPAILVLGTCPGGYASFQQLQSLAGEWDGKDESGAAVITASAWLPATRSEILKHGYMDEMPTLYGEDDAAAGLLNEQCAADARYSRAETGQAIGFEFQGPGNLPDSASGHQHRLVIEFEDAAHLAIEMAGTWEGYATGHPSRPQTKLTAVAAQVLCVRLS